MVRGIANPGASLLSEADGNNGTISPVPITYKDYCIRKGECLSS